MSFNFCHPVFEPQASCDKVSLDGYEVTNLVSAEHGRSGRGFLASSFVTPPVSVTLKFFCQVDVERVLLHPQVGQQKSLGFEVSFPGQPGVGRGFVGEAERGLCFRKWRCRESGLPEGFAVRLLGGQSRGCTDTLVVRIVKTRGSSVPALRRVEVWGQPSRLCGRKVLAECHKRWAEAVAEPRPPSLGREVGTQVSETSGKLTRACEALEAVSAPLPAASLADLSRQLAEVSRPASEVCERLSRLPALLQPPARLLAELSVEVRALGNPSGRCHVSSQLFRILSEMSLPFARLSDCLSALPREMSRGPAALSGMSETTAEVCKSASESAEMTLELRMQLSKSPGFAFGSLSELSSKLLELSSRLSRLLPELLGSVVRLSRPLLSPQPLADLSLAVARLPTPFPRLRLPCTPLSVPTDFVDAITCELMVLPMALPCGQVVDQSTLERFADAEANWGRPPSNPFTGKTFTDTHKPVVATALKSRMDAWLVSNADSDEVRALGRTVGRAAPSRGPKRKAEETVTSQTKRTETGCVEPPVPDDLDSLIRDTLKGLDSYTRFGASEEPSCAQCGTKENLYELPCGHLTCRGCLFAMGGDKKCCECARAFQSGAVTRFHP